jgi:hypothetical protein
MEQGMTRNKAHATEEHRDGLMEARKRRRSSMTDARSSGEQAEVVGQEIRAATTPCNNEYDRENFKLDFDLAHQRPACTQRGHPPGAGDRQKLG